MGFQYGEGCEKGGRFGRISSGFSCAGGIRREEPPNCSSKQWAKYEWLLKPTESAISATVPAFFSSSSRARWSRMRLMSSVGAMFSEGADLSVQLDSAEKHFLGKVLNSEILPPHTPLHCGHDPFQKLIVHGSYCHFTRFQFHAIAELFPQLFLPELYQVPNTDHKLFRIEGFEKVVVRSGLQSLDPAIGRGSRGEKYRPGMWLVRLSCFSALVSSYPSISGIITSLTTRFPGSPRSLCRILPDHSKPRESNTQREDNHGGTLVRRSCPRR